MGDKAEPDLSLKADTDPPATPAPGIDRDRAAADLPPEFRRIEGRSTFRDALLELIAASEMSLHVQSWDLDRDIYGHPDVVDAVRAFVLRHGRSHVRILINGSQRAMAAGHRLIEFARGLSSRIEFRQLPAGKRALVEDAVIGDGRHLLLRQRPDDLEARVYEQAGPARLRDQQFRSLWDHAEPARELQSLRL